MIELKNVTKVYNKGGTAALSNVSLSVDRGEFVFVVGASGAGKSTLIKLLLKEETPNSGEVFVNGYNLNTLKHQQIPKFRRTLGIVFQDFRLIPTMNVYDNVAFALRVTDVSNRDIRKRVPYILSLVGLETKARRLPESSSVSSSRRRLFSLINTINLRTISSDLSFKSLCPRTAVFNRAFNAFNSLLVGFTLSFAILSPVEVPHAPATVWKSGFALFDFS